MPKSLKIFENSLWNDNEKYEARCCNGKRHTPSTDLRKCVKMHSFCNSRCCFAHAMDAKIAQNRRKPDFAWIRPIFGSKSTKFRRLVQSVTWTWPKALRTWKSLNFVKYYLAVLKTWFLTHFWKVPIEDFRWFSSISRFCFIFLRRFVRYKEANCIQIRSFSRILHGSEQFSVQNALGAKCRRSCPPRGGSIRSV